MESQRKEEVFIVGIKYALLMICIGALGVTSMASAHPSKVPHRHLEERTSPPKSAKAKHQSSGVTFSFGPSLNHFAPEEGIVSQDILELGGGAELSFGVRVNPYVGLQFNGMLTLHQGGAGTSMGGVFMGAFTVDSLVYMLPNAQRIEPYALVGLGVFSLSGGGLQSTLEGFGVQAGLGARVRINPALSLALEGILRLAYLDNSRNGGFDEPFSSALLFSDSLAVKIVLDL
jgi:hypothetical protein